MDGLFVFFNIIVNLFVLGFMVYYVFSLRAREKELEKKEDRVGNAYRHIVSNAVDKERKILEHATNRAEEIIDDAGKISSSYHEIVDNALKKIVADIQREANVTSKDLSEEYTNSLTKLTHTSLADYQNVARDMMIDLQKQVKHFHEVVLPGMEKELAEYKQARIKETDEMVVRVIQKVSQEILNKSISLDDHKNLLIESLERAKKEGTFE